MKAVATPITSKGNLTAEHIRQQECLDELPDSFEFPLFNALTALQSQRKSGYKNSAAAAREIIDNSVEAGADKVHIVFESERTERNKQSRVLVKSIAFIDNGPGMLPMMARYALSWGGGTHFNQHDFIGKFGFGLPNASINQTIRTEVYTRLPGQQTITQAVLDISTFSRNGIQSIPEPVQVKSLPAFVERYLENQKWQFTQGTVVVWKNPDQLTYRTPANLKEHLLEDFGVTYRYLLKRFTLVVEGVTVKPIDPLFLTPDFELYLPRNEGGAEEVVAGVIPVVYFQLSTGEWHLKRTRDFINETDTETEDISIAVNSSISYKVARFPYGFAQGDSKKDKDAVRRFEIRKSRRGMSFVRAGREIEIVDAFPKVTKDKATGLGKWPLLQSYAYHWGIEVQFSPDLDDVFGITNDKQRVRPAEDFWRVLVAEEIDDILRHENTKQRDIRKDGSQPIPKSADAPSYPELAAHDANRVLNQTNRIPAFVKTIAQKNFDRRVLEMAERDGISVDESRKKLDAIIKVQPYKVEYVDYPFGPAWIPEWYGHQIVIQINRAHEFYKDVYSPMLTKQDQLMRYGVDLLLITISRTELREEDREKSAWHKALRERDWSDFLKASIISLSARISSTDEPE